MQAVTALRPAGPHATRRAQTPPARSRAAPVFDLDHAARLQIEQPGRDPVARHGGPFEDLGVARTGPVLVARDQHQKIAGRHVEDRAMGAAHLGALSSALMPAILCSNNNSR